MPELPEVHALAVDLGARLTGRTIRRLDVLAIAALKTFAVPPEALRGKTITGVTRHGKFLDIAAREPAVDGGEDEIHLVLHLARAGWVRWRAAEPKTSARPGRAPRNPLAARLLLEPDGAGLDITEAGTKKSLQLHLVRDPLEIERVRTLGPEPLEPAFTREVFAGILKSAGRSQIKGVLRDQATIAGIGNAYSDEILWAAKMSPFKAAAMTDAEIDRLYAALQSTLRDAVDRSEGLAASELKAEKHEGLRVHGRAGEACPVCGSTIRQVTFHDSSLQYCPGCQTGGKILADRVLSRLLK
ncbi:Fpg/Nei family DNA glycosylase [Gryllotalpicola protaetiae]|uniref:Fpg/Nei family DNA glycosylase n=1 Tax=Gryllotalpicola protaetiae TaxID=2419771 RepID=A0A387BP31_9MICO|nr:DNA-formamidopyrimidine glycosylase family protein [Gryllotalpicola protaetiae]AYG03794.1 Fpg/Nei family DNA glycosylase [Gryllotalpicola protaetiae]